MIQRTACLSSLLLILVIAAPRADAQSTDELKARGKLIVNDNFDRSNVGKAWSTNDARAQRTSGIEKSKFVSQAHIHDGTFQIRRTEGSDHGASVKTSAEFTDAVIQLRFRLTGNERFGVNVNDPKCKSVHAGHICRVEIGPKHVLIQDQKTGNMHNDYRKARDEGASKEALAKRVEGKSTKLPANVASDAWHDLSIVVRGDNIAVTIDDTKVGQFGSAGIGHATKRNIAFAVANSVDVDDLRIWALPQ